MQKLTVKTSGPFFLLDRYSRAEIDENPTEVPFTPFIEERIANGDLINLDGDLPEKLADAEAAPDEIEEAAPKLVEDEHADPHNVPSASEEAVAESAATKVDPLDHDNDGHKGGSKPKNKRGK